VSANALREAIDSGKPFRLRSGDGAVIDVPTRDHAFLNPTGRLVVVFTDNDGARVLDVAPLTAIDYAKAPEDLGDKREESANKSARSVQPRINTNRHE